MNFSSKKVIIPLLLIGAIGLILRLYYFHPEIPFTGDATVYFVYAIKTSSIGHLPEDFTPINNGWPSFLSIFFSIFNFNDALSYMQLQRMISVFVSVLTIVPVYFLCNRFFSKPYSLVGTAIFTFEPRIIQNSLLGGTDPLYILLVATVLALFLSSNKKIVYISFAVTAFSTMVRPEGLFLFFAISVMFFVRYRKERLVIPRYVPAILIFILILTPMSLYRIDIRGEDGISSRIFTTLSYHVFAPEENSERFEKLSPPQKEGIQTGDQIGLTFLLKGIENFSKYLAWNSIPIFVFFLPVGVFLIFKNLNYRTMTIILSTIFMFIPAFYAYSIPLQETRYLYFLYPLFCVISIFTLSNSFFEKRIKQKNITLVLIIGAILLASILFLNFKQIDYEHKKEIVTIAKLVATTANGINGDSSDISYMRSAEIIVRWPDLPKTSSDGHIFRQVSVVSSSGFNSLEEFLINSKDAGLSHLVIDGMKERPEFLKDVFYNEEEYSFLTKEFDSNDQGFNYHVKIYKIDYDNLEEK